MTPEARVARGAALLDEHVPCWREMVSAAKLDIQNGRYCILGQVFGDAYDADEETLASNAYLFGVIALAEPFGIRVDEWGEGADEVVMASFGVLTSDEDGDDKALEAAWRTELAKC